MAEQPATARGPLATADDIRRILGTLDDAKLLDIVALQPTVVDVEEASCGLRAIRMSSARVDRFRPRLARLSRF